MNRVMPLRRRCCLLRHAQDSIRTSTVARFSISKGGARGDKNGDGTNATAINNDSKNRAHVPGGTDKPDLHAAQHQAQHRAQETIGIKLASRVAERVAEGAEHRAASKTIAMAGKHGAKAIGKRAAAKSAARAVSPQRQAAKRFVLRYFPVNFAAKRFGRGILIAIPIAGATFSAWLARSDLRRTYEELEIARADHARAVERIRQQHLKQSTDRTTNANTTVASGAPPEDTPADHHTSAPKIDTSTVKCFGVATAADSVNVVAHLLVAYGLYQGWEPDPLIALESTSLFAAVVSTGGAVGGEYLSARRAATLLSEAEEEDRADDFKRTAAGE